MRKLPAVLERLFDVACAFSGLLLLMPVFAGIALLILWDDGRPVLFRQTRVGRAGKPFIMWKFRTMRAASQGPAITAARDRRVTRTGVLLRRLKLDELPQLFNVLKGHMSLIGPRPEVPEYVQFDSPIWQAVLQVRPGITDLATLICRDEEKILGSSGDPSAYYRDVLLPAKLVMNMKYHRSRSFARDLKLILLTIRYSLFPQSFTPDRVARTFQTEIGAYDKRYLHSLSRSFD
jgi:lipopolysaccharide/colanic/teichoic acid biosynthesis glycosyltransferase